jgi:hypothetical protein
MTTRKKTGAYAPNPKGLSGPRFDPTKLTAAARRLALQKSAADWQTCLSFADWLESFQVGMLKAHAPWSAKQFDAIHDAELTLSTAMAWTIERHKQLMGVQR